LTALSFGEQFLSFPFRLDPDTLTSGSGLPRNETKMRRCGFASALERLSYPDERQGNVSAKSGSNCDRLADVKLGARDALG
jgi:hypothetical protein